MKNDAAGKTSHSWEAKSVYSPRLTVFFIKIALIITPKNLQETDKKSPLWC